MLQGEEEGTHGEQQDAKVALEHGAVLLPVSGDPRLVVLQSLSSLHRAQRSGASSDGAIAKGNGRAVAAFRTLLLAISKLGKAIQAGESLDDNCAGVEGEPSTQLANFGLCPADAGCYSPARMADQ